MRQHNGFVAEYRLRNGEIIYVDDDILTLMEGKSWNVSSTGSVRWSHWDKERGKPVALALTHLIMGAPERGWLWMHANGDWRNFHRDNLIPVQRGKHHPKAFGAMSQEDREANGKRGGEMARSAQGKKNGLGFRGISSAGLHFRAMATVDGKQTYLGLFGTKEDAARAYDAALVKQGLAAVNFPDG